MPAVASAPDLWNQVKAELKSVFPEEIFQLWFDRLAVVEDTPERIVLGAPNEMIEIWVTENYLDLLRDKLRAASGRRLNVAVRKAEASALAPSSGDTTSPIVIPEATHRAPAVRRGRGSDGAPAAASSLNPKNTFENFVVGPNNQMAHAAAVSVAKAPAQSYNPLLVYGETGLGKTHLMHAVGHYVLKVRPESRVCYVSSEKFTNDFIDSIRDNTTTKFRQRYRSVDVLLIDDIQFFSGRERTQEEFFHTFNDLFESGKQIFLSSDRPVSEIDKLEKRLVTRFQWGMTADIKAPDVETRIAILRNKAAAMLCPVGPNVLAFIAEHVTSNIRQLEGALVKVASYSALCRSAIDLKQAEDLLRDILIEEAKRQLTIDRIQKRVAEHFGLRPTDMVSRRRPANIAAPRQIAMYLARELTRHSLQEIGESFGGRDHGTVIHAVRTVQNQMQQDGQFRAAVEYLRGQLAR